MTSEKNIEREEKPLKMGTTEKNRYWTFDFFVEKKSEKKKKLKEIVEYLDETHLKYTISPWHDKDINPDKTKKKTHAHAMVCWDGPTTYNRAKEILGPIACNGYIQRVDTARGLYRYFIHADNPEKFQYKDEDRIHGNGFNPADLMSETDKRKIQMEVCQIITKAGIYEFAELCDLLLDGGMIAEWSVVASNVNYFKTYLMSKRHSHLIDNALDEARRKDHKADIVQVYKEAEK